MSAREGIRKINQGQEQAIQGWLAYGRAMNEARSMFPSDEKFGQWVSKNGLCQVATHDGTRDVDRHERAAAMWAAANPSDFEKARAASGATTVRGIYVHWKQFQAITGWAK